MEKQIWIAQQLAIVDSKIVNYTERQVTMASVKYLTSAIEAVPALIKHTDAYEHFKGRVERLTLQLPEKETTFSTISFSAYNKELNSFRKYLAKNYKMVPKPYYITIMMSMGIAIGVAIGISFKNTAIGISMGIAIGVGIGAYLDAKAAKEGRVLG